MLSAHGVHDVSFVDLRLREPAWDVLTYSAIGASNESFVLDIPDLPLVLHLLHHLPETDVWRDLERAPWLLRYCRARKLSAPRLGASLRRTRNSVSQWAASLREPVFVGFTTWISNYLTTLVACAELKRLPQPPFIILGGPQCSESTISAELALASGLADAVVIGEGEQSFLELQAQIDPASRTLTGPPPPGVKVWRDGQPVFGGRRAQISVDDLPLPNFDLMDLDAYSYRDREIITEVSRGCTDRCEFCSETVFWEHFRSGTPGAVIGRLAALKRQTNFSHVLFSDSLLNGHPARLVSLAEGLLSSGPRFTWSGFMRASIEPPTAALLARAGLKHVFIGVESMSDATLLKMNKRREGSQNVHAVETFLEAGISVAAGVVAGFPGDSKEEFAHTVDALKPFFQRYPRQFQVSVEPFVLTPGAPMFHRAHEFGLSMRPWDDEAIDMAPSFAPIARRCMALVEGVDQGADRARKFRLAKHRLIDDCGCSPPAASTTSRAEQVSTRDLGEWILAMGPGKSSSETWLLTQEEYARFGKRRLDAASIEKAVGSSLIRWSQPFAPGAGARGVAYDRVDRIGLHPSVVGRVCQSSQRLLLFNRATETLYYMDWTMAGFARYIAEQLRSIEDVLSGAKAWGLTRKEVRDTISRWWSQRVIMGLPSANAPPAPKKETFQILTEPRP